MERQNMTEKKKRITKIVTKSVDIRMRVTEKRKQEIKEYAKKNNMTITELLEYGLSCVIIDLED